MLPRGILPTASIVVAAVFVLNSVAYAASDVWDNVPGGSWENNANWTDGSTPGISDTATFNLPQSYSVTFGVEPGVIQSLSVTAGTVTLRSSGETRTLNLTAGAGNQDIVASGATTSLTLGTDSNPLHLNAGDDLAIRNGATLAVLFGSHVSAFDLSDSGLNGTLFVDGAESMLTLSGTIANSVGTSGSGSVVFQNNSIGNTINGSLGLASSATPGATGELSILSGASLSLGANLTLANQNVTGQVGSVTVNGADSLLTQTGTSTITVGSAANGAATIAIGTAASGGTLTTGTGLFTINKTGTVTIGSGPNAGTLNLAGNLIIDGGLLQKASEASTFNLADGKTVTIQAGGRLSLAGPSTADSNQVFNVSGASSRLEINGTSALTIGGGTQVNLTAGGALTAGGRIDVGNGAASAGTLSVAGSGSTATGGSQLSVWASDGGSADVSFSDGAVGTFSAGLDLANSSTDGTTAIVDVQTGAQLNTGDLNLASAGGTATSAMLNVSGTDSGVLLATDATLTVGHASAGAAAINVGVAHDGGTLTTGSGLFKINKTGIVTIGDGDNRGTLEVLGNITVDGGLLQEGSNTSTFAWATGKTLTIQNGGRVQFASSYTTAASSQHLVSGAGSTFDVSGAVQLRNGAQLTVGSGGSIVANQFDVGGGGTSGTITVDGTDSSATGGNGASHWGSGGAANVTFSNHASATLGGPLQLAESATTVVNVISGANLAVGDLTMTNSGVAASATLNIFGGGSTVALGSSSQLVVGHATTGTATVNLDGGGALSIAAGGGATVNATGIINVNIGTAELGALAIAGGTVNVNGGTLAFTTLGVSGGAVKFNAGRIEQTGNLVADDGLLTILLGPKHELGLGRTLSAAAGTATISTNLDLVGGRLEGNAINVVNTAPNATLLRIRNGGTAQFTGGATLAVGTTTFVEDSSALIAGGQITQAGELQLVGTGRVAGGTLTNSGLIAGSGRIDATLDNLSTGQIRVGASQRLLLRGGSHLNNGLIDVDGGELEIATGALTNGSVNPATATILARHASLRFTDGITNTGSIICSEGVCNVFGNVTNVASQPTTGRIVITANSQATFFGDVVNEGTIQVSAAGIVASTAVFLGSLSGAGVSGSGSVFLEGDVSPGAGPGTMAFGGDVSLGSSAVLNIELAGTAPGTQFDRLTAEQSLNLNGTLDVVFVAGFLPAAGQSFDLIDWGTRNGSFATINLPALTGLSWNTSQLYTAGVLSISTAISGDFNDDGTVNAADYTVWRNGLGTSYTPEDYEVWKSHFGQTAGSGSAGASPSHVPVPEPTSAVAMVCGVLAVVAGSRLLERSR
jgi:fibronectin-binding autotransporter adhesin